jgi:hypothetical protein
LSSRLRVAGSSAAPRSGVSECPVAIWSHGAFAVGEPGAVDITDRRRHPHNPLAYSVRGKQ